MTNNAGTIRPSAHTSCSSLGQDSVSGSSLPSFVSYTGMPSLATINSESEISTCPGGSDSMLFDDTSIKNASYAPSSNYSNIQITGFHVPHDDCAGQQLDSLSPTADRRLLGSRDPNKKAMRWGGSHDSSAAESLHNMSSTTRITEALIDSTPSFVPRRSSLLIDSLHLEMPIATTTTTASEATRAGSKSNGQTLGPVPSRRGSVERNNATLLTTLEESPGAVSGLTRRMAMQPPSIISPDTAPLPARRRISSNYNIEGDVTTIRNNVGITANKDKTNDDSAPIPAVRRISDVETHNNDLAPVVALDSLPLPPRRRTSTAQRPIAIMGRRKIITQPAS